MHDAWANHQNVMTFFIIETKQLYLGQEKSSYVTALKNKIHMYN